MSRDQEKIVHKIRALLNLARNGGDPKSNEAQTALLTAQRIMAEYGLEEVEFREPSDGLPPKEVLDNYATDFEKLSWWKKRLGKVIGQNFRCYSYLNKCDGYTRLVFIGLKDDVAIALEVFAFATDLIRVGANQYMKTYRREFLSQHGSRPDISLQRGMRNNYVEGWISGLDSQYTEQITKEGWGLVLAKDAVVIAAYKNLGLERGRSSAHSLSQGSVSQSAYAKGYSDGKSFRASHQRIS
ncbi:DUF2786 domain-containing protein [Desulfosporosinus sp. PR]|uniref:DUF2786 domain-containing protein n=1 Tax=Candidatus Desulfosporosinus nitrosoreducens TaxID=3401928 RepID=UPI0027ECE8B4|nr:DUF2786 domain-containing protein [Desulfosporosinus sp. PR]MDQ7094972.1 DUF2786 domain-containing protein [Desulfosporosinus sp. PR]